MIVVEERKVAAQVLSKFKVMFPSFGAKMDSDQEWTNLMLDEWGMGLRGMQQIDVLQAVELVRRSGSDFAPSLPKFVEYCGGRPKLHNALDHVKEPEVNDYPFHKVPGYIKKWFIEYNKQHRGWTAQESNMMIKFHAQPTWLDVSDDDQDNRRERINDMVDQHQKKIINYFINRSNA